MNYLNVSIYYYTYIITSRASFKTFKKKTI